MRRLDAPFSRERVFRFIIILFACIVIRLAFGCFTYYAEDAFRHFPIAPLPEVVLDRGIIADMHLVAENSTDTDPVATVVTDTAVLFERTGLTDTAIWADASEGYPHMLIAGHLPPEDTQMWQLTDWDFTAVQPGQTGKPQLEHTDTQCNTATYIQSELDRILTAACADTAQEVKVFTTSDYFIATVNNHESNLIDSFSKIMDTYHGMTLYEQFNRLKQTI